MTHPAFIVVDLFCGAGGTSLGFDRAKINGVNIAEVIACVNHDALAIRNHSKNFPKCVHFTEDVRAMDMAALAEIVRHYRILYPNAKLILWASLECTHFSNAKTGSRDADSRTLAWVLPTYIQALNPDLVMIENVREFMSWGPLVAKIIRVKSPVSATDDNWNDFQITGDYCPLFVNKKTGKLEGTMVPENRKKGADYIKWRQAIEHHGYRYKSKLMNSADFGSHQSRLRYFGIFAKPEMPIEFPQYTHSKTGKDGMQKWKAVREVLDLHDIGMSIFDRKKPLSPNTLKRILAGLIKFVANGQHFYIVKNYGGDPGSKVSSIESPHPTITTIPHEMLVSADFICQYNGLPGNCNFKTDVPCRTLTTKDRFALVKAMWIDNKTKNGRPTSSEEPCTTLVTEPGQKVVSVFIDNQYSGFGNYKGSTSIESPSGALTTVNKKAMVHAEFLMPTNYSNLPSSLDEPSPTLTANRKFHYVVGTERMIAKQSHYLLNPQYNNKGGSIDEPCFTLIAKMDKMPPQLVTIDPIGPGENHEFVIDPEYFNRKEIDVSERIRVFMQVYGIKDIYMRMLNISELKRVQGLDINASDQDPTKEYILEGPKNEQKKQIGNAVVPVVVQKWAEALAMAMQNNGSADKFEANTLFNQPIN